MNSSKGLEMKLEVTRSAEKFGGCEVRIDGKLFDNAIGVRQEGETFVLELRFDADDVSYFAGSQTIAVPDL